MFAVVEFNKVQYKVYEGKSYNFANFEYDEKKPSVTADKVMLLSDGKDVKVGTPYVDGASVTFDIIGKLRSKKIRVFKFRAKKRYKRTAGSKTDFVKVSVSKINLK